MAAVVSTNFSLTLKIFTMIVTFVAGTKRQLMLPVMVKTWKSQQSAHVLEQLNRSVEVSTRESRNRPRTWTSALLSTVWFSPSIAVSARASERRICLFALACLMHALRLIHPCSLALYLSPNERPRKSHSLPAHMDAVLYCFSPCSRHPSP